MQLIKTADILKTILEYELQTNEFAGTTSNYNNNNLSSRIRL